ncbi:MAG: hypothetical protein ACW9W9_00540 [Candidatus Nitrosopumilus sp. Bin_571-38]|jgi:hypothetical protein
MKFTLLVIGVIAIVLTLMIFFLIPFIDEFETFNCITAPCDMPKITIAEKIGQSFIEE